MNFVILQISITFFNTLESNKGDPRIKYVA